MGAHAQLQRQPETADMEVHGRAGEAREIYLSCGKRRVYTRRYSLQLFRG